ncbi:hypothetical protein JUN65_06140 [Gluconacetobacter azotocaptans]|uniref:hypothetical protein n=1 Tax=Gluconacetobacter azotocaptans TaxID=142834 RepID=UPI00195B7C37|nr:hypothetical protein [Gluconacetobacter azotocaptans]MBM9401161.1 hypothetical protein [Gluconacetobacter azotocaptans]
MPDNQMTEAEKLAWGINRCSVDDLTRIRDREQGQWCDKGSSHIVQEWNTFLLLAANREIEHFVLFDCFLVDDADLDPVDHATELARPGTMISDVVDGNVVIGFASQDGREDFIAWGTRTLAQVASND